MDKNDANEKDGLEITNFSRSGAIEYVRNSRILFDHFHVIKMMNDTRNKIRRKESRINAILKHMDTNN